MPAASRDSESRSNVLQNKKDVKCLAFVLLCHCPFPPSLFSALCYCQPSQINSCSVTWMKLLILGHKYPVMQRYRVMTEFSKSTMQKKSFFYGC